MFREMRRFRQQVSTEVCKQVLKTERRAAFSVIGDDGYPYTVPINFYYDEADGKIYFHGAQTGHKLDAVRRCNRVCFTTWNAGTRRAGHWEWDVTSVVAFGRVSLVTDPGEVRDRLRQLAEKYYPTVDEVAQEMNRSEDKPVQVFAIEIEHMTGKLVNER